MKKRMKISQLSSTNLHKFGKKVKISKKIHIKFKFP